MEDILPRIAYIIMQMAVLGQWHRPLDWQIAEFKLKLMSILVRDMNLLDGIQVQMVKAYLMQ